MIIVLTFEKFQLPPLELIYSEGDGGKEMFFLNRGVIQLSIMLVLERNADFRKKIQGYVLDVKKSKPGKQMMWFVRGEDRIECPTFNWVLNETTCSHFGESVLSPEMGGNDVRSFPLSLSVSISVSVCLRLALPVSVCL